MHFARILFSKSIQDGIRLNLHASHFLDIGGKRAFSSSSRSLSYTRTEVSIPVPITRGHLAAQLWEHNTAGASTSSSTPIICMHGFQDASSSFDPLIPLILKDGMKIVSVDLPGHGLSSHIPGAGIDSGLDGVATIHRVMRFFKWEKVVLLGHSYGAILSFLFTTTFADKVEKYIAIENFHPIPRDPNWHLERTCRKLFEIEEKLTNSKKKQPSYTFEEIMQRTYKSRKGTVTEEGVETLLKRGAAPDPNSPGLFQFTHDLKTNIPSMFGRVGSDEALAMAGKIKCPVCVIKGEPGEDYERRENFLKVVEAAKQGNGGNLELHLVPGSHHVHLNEPNSVAPIISKFLEK